jgi:hypothetical protein
MTQDEIIEMARKINFNGRDECLVAFAKLVAKAAKEQEYADLIRIIEANVASEREACAKVCDDQANSAYWEGADACAYRIRARGETHE